MLHAMSQNWWMPVVRGVLAILFGILALFLPGLALFSLILLFGIYAAADGLFNIAAAFSSRLGNQKWYVSLLEGIVGVIAGIIAFVYPGLTGLALLYLIAAWAIVTGVFEIWGAVELCKEIDDEWWLALSGGLSVLFGILLVAWPATGALAVVWMIATYAILFGALLIGFGFRMRSADNESESGPGEMAHA